ncbi:hypothetical protein KCU65_g9528, partial [Aureobasidium melanogenum]
MASAEKIMPGGRWLSVPGNNFESAFYALAIGLSTRPHLQRPVNWSELTLERKLFVSLTELWKTKGPFHGNIHDMLGKPIFLSVMFNSLISLLNARGKVGDWAVFQQKEDGWEPLSNSHESLTPRTVLVRQVKNRWECFGYFEQDRGLAIPPRPNAASSTSSAEDKIWNDLFDSPGHDSSQVSEPTSNDAGPSNTFSPIIQVDIKPSPDTAKVPDTHDPKSCPAADSWENRPMESAVRNLRDLSAFLTTPIEELCCWTEVLDKSRNKSVRPIIDHLFARHMALGHIALEALKSISDSATEQEKEMVLAMMKGFTKPKRDERVEQQKEEAGEQKKDEDLKQEEDGGTQRKGDGDIKQRKRKEVEAAAAAYAARDRDDSCSDSD